MAAPQPPAAQLTELEIVNHAEALQLAHMQRANFNLAQCYIEIVAEREALRAQAEARAEKAEQALARLHEAARAMILGISIHNERRLNGPIVGPVVDDLHTAIQAAQPPAEVAKPAVKLPPAGEWAATQLGSWIIDERDSEWVAALKAAGIETTP